MVAFTNINQGIKLLVVFSGLLLGLAEAAPVAGNEEASISTEFVPPPFIPSRVSWTSNENLVKRASEEKIGNLTLDLPANAPPIPAAAADPGVVMATSAQIAQFKKYAAITATAYCDLVVPFNSWTCLKCLMYVPDGKLIKTFSSLIADTTGFVLRSDADKTIYLVFRGTNSIRSAITDMIYDLDNYTPATGARVHRGFYSSVKEVMSTYFPAVQSQLTAYPNYKVVVTGHSLGAAQALLAGMDLYQRDSRLSPDNLSIYTMGGPRIGNQAFANYVISTGIFVSRSVNGRDVVPHVPPTLNGYIHVGVEAWARTSSSIQICTSQIESDLCANTIAPFTSMIDHLTYYDISYGGCL
ncbi:MAG: lipase [Benjaminiella poitrasii]|nr:MAG: lipase [Benjaminiella poitrasii]